MKKAQNAGQLFVYIVAIVIVGAILLFGYKAISIFLGKQEQIELVEFKRGLEESIESISSEYGSMKTKIFAVSPDYREVCFITNYGVSDYGSYADQFTGYPLIKDSVLSDTGKNVFLIKNDGSLDESFEIGKIKLAGKIFDCISISNSKLSLRFEGRGDHVVIS